MQIARYFLSYLLLAVLLVSFLAYPLFETLQYTLLHETQLGQLSFRKMVDRLYLVTVAIVIIYMVKRYRLADARAIGLVVAPTKAAAIFGKGFMLGAIVIVLSGTVLVLFDIRYLLQSSYEISLPKLVLVSFFTALLVALVEETFFRGILLSRNHPGDFLWGAVLTSSLLYATVHFATPGLVLEVDEVGWFSAFLILFSAFHKLSEPQFIGSFLTLFIFGVYLCFLRSHYRHLWASIGVHTGAVMLLKLYFETTQVDKQSARYWLVGNYDNVTGYLTALVLLVVLAGHWYLAKKFRPPA